jgi:hypothetical protein
MITAERLQSLTTFSPNALQVALGKRADGYEFTGARFLGITNGGQFCYSVVYKIDANERDSTKVYLTYNPADGTVIADIG